VKLRGSDAFKEREGQHPSSSFFDAAGNSHLFAAPPGGSFGCGSADANLGVLAPTGGCASAKKIISGSATAISTALDPAGELLLGVRFDSTVDVGCGPASNANAVSYLVAKLDASGACLWQKVFTGPTFAFSVNQHLDVRSDAQGGVVLSGSFDGSADFGGGPFSLAFPSGSALIKLDAAGGFRWSKSVNTQNYVWTGGALGDVYVASNSEQFDLGTGPLLTKPGLVVAKIAK
jgi:hypothetical protein